MADVKHERKRETPGAQEAELERRRSHRGLQWHELAANPKLTLRDFMCITGANPDGRGEWGIHRLTEQGVRLALDFNEENIRGRSYEYQDDVRALKKAPALDFPCDARDLLAFVDGSVAGSDFQVADKFRRAVGALPSVAASKAVPRDMQRVNALAEDIEGAVIQLEETGRRLTMSAVWNRLTTYAGKDGSSIISATHRQIRFRKGHEDATLDRKNLADRLARRARRTKTSR